MAEKSHLAFYKIEFHEPRKPDKKYKVNDVLGKDIYDILKTELAEKKTLINPAKESTVESSGKFYTNDSHRNIYGFLEKGKMGMRGTVKDTDVYNDTKKHRRITDKDAITNALFYLLHVPENSDSAFLLTERIGRSGLSQHFEYVLKSKINFNCSVKFEKAYPRRIMKEFIENGTIQEFILKKHNPPSHLAAKLGGVKETDKGVFEVKFKPPRSKIFNQGPALKKYLNDLDVSFFTTDFFTNLGFDDNEHEKEIQISYGGNKKRINLKSPFEETANIIIEEEVKEYRLRSPTEKLTNYYKVFLTYLQILLGYKLD